MKRIRLPSVRATRSIGILCCWVVSLLAGARGEDWQIHRFEGRDYVSLDNVATFYGFPPPPALEPPSDGATAGAAPAPVPPPASRTVTLDNGKSQLAVTANNLFDTAYVARCTSDTACFYGNRRTVLASLVKRW